MKTRTFESDRHDEAEGFEVAKFFATAGAMTGALTLLIWLTMSAAGWASRFNEYRVTVVLAALFASLLTASVIFDGREQRRRPPGRPHGHAHLPS